MPNFVEKKQWMVERNRAYGSDFLLYLFLHREDSAGYTRRAAIGFQVFEIKEDERCEDPLTLLSPGEAQQLMDELYAAGVRPSEGQGSAGAMKATERHLEDMRSLVFEALKVQKKK